MTKLTPEAHRLPSASSIELGPDLPMPAYSAMERWQSERIGALALYCSDGRWGDAFDEFCHRHLRLPRYDRWAVPGGPAWLAVPDDPLLAGPRMQLDFLVKAHDLQRVVLITHYGCAWYGERLAKSPDECLATQFREVQAAAATLRSWHPQLAVEGFLGMRRLGHLTFHELEIGRL